MNTPLRRLSTVVMAMFLALMVATTLVQYVQAPRLNNDNRNVRTLYAEYNNYRGGIIVDGKAIAYSRPVEDSFGFQRRYTDGDLYAPVTGFYSVVYGRSGIEKYANDILTGTADTLFWSRMQDLITGRQQQGSSVELTIDAKVQQAAWDALGDQKGAVVAIDPQTGAILAMVSKPSYDPSLLAAHSTTKVNRAYTQLLGNEGDPLVNRTIAGDTYPPGSVFKLVVAAAALQEKGLTPDSEVASPRTLKLPLSSASIENYGGESCGADRITLTRALTISCNTAFAQLGLDLGADTLRAQAEAFGFDSALSVPMPVTPSRYPANPDLPQTALSAIGQQDVRVTPLQVALITAAIANGGHQMQPYLVQTVRSPDLTVVSTTKPRELRTPITAATADALRQMMLEVVRTGTGRPAQISGVDVAGKTGTAQTTPGADPHAWFTAFAPASNPRVAVAVVVEHGGSLGSEATGGRVAAPIARAVIEAVLNR